MPAAGTNSEQLLLQIAATTELLRRELQRGRRDIDDFTDDADRNARRVEARFDAMGKKIGSALKTGVEVGAAALTAGFVAAAKASFDLASSLGETAQQLGVGTKFLQEYRYAATQTGAEVEDADKAIGKFGLTVGKAREGNAEATAALAKFGVTARDLTTLDTAELFAKVADGASRISDPTRLAADAVAVFGKGGRAIIPVLSGGAKGLNEFADAAERKGLIISDEAIDNMDALADKGAEIKAQFTSALANAIGENSDAFTRLGAGLSAAAAGALKFAATDPERIKQVAAAIAGAYAGGRIAGLPGALAGGVTAGVLTDAGFQRRAAGLTEVVRRKGLFGATVFGGGGAEVNEAYADPRQRAALDRADVAKAQKELADLTKRSKPTGIAAFFDTSNSPAEIAAAKKRLATAKQFAAESAAALREIDAAAAAAARPKPKAPPKVNDFDVDTPDDKAAEAAARKAKAAADRAAKLLATKALKSDTLLGTSVLPFETREDVSEQLEKPLREAAESARLFESIIGGIEPELSSAAIPGLQQLAAEMENAERFAEDFGRSLSTGIADVIFEGRKLGDVLVDTFKRAGAQLLESQIFKLLGGSNTGGSSTGFLGGIAKAIFGGGFAEGGTPPAGKISLVGERGPELLIGNGKALVQPLPGIFGRGGGGGGRQPFDVRVSVTPSPLFVTSVVAASQAAGQQAAADQYRGATRVRLPGH